MSRANSMRATGCGSAIPLAVRSGRWRSNCPEMGAESRQPSSQVHLIPCQRRRKAAKRQAIIQPDRPTDQDSIMKHTMKLLPPLALVGALALVPVTASSFAAADTTNYQELEKFMSVYERVKESYVERAQAGYVEAVGAHTLIKGAIDGSRAALDPHSTYAEGAEFDQLKTSTD